MSYVTTEASYESDLAAAEDLIQQTVDYSEADGNMRNWAQDALNNEWVEGITIENWVKRALGRLGYASGSRG